MAAAIRMTVTAAGRAALRNLAGNGTNAVIIATAGLTATAFVSGQPVPAEIKRVATIKGGATAADTIHVTISDTGTDVYSVRGFGLYLTDNTLFASYGQTDVIVEKSAQAAMLLAADIQFADIDATQITFGDTNFSNPAATTEVLGVVELATDDETVAGTDSVRAVTAKGLLAALNARLGNSAPSTFVKTLLTAATALAFRAALGLKSASTFDTGADNGLDADKLDGQHGSFYQAWGNLTGVPAAFPPAGHKHDASDITTGILPVPRGGTGAATFAVGNIVVGNDVGALGSITPAQALVAIGAAPKAHSHIITDVIGLTDALAGKASTAHTHVIADVTGLQAALDGKVPKTGGTIVGSIDLSPTTGQIAALAVNAVGIGGRSWLALSVGNGWGGGAGVGNFVIYNNSGADGLAGMKMQMDGAGNTTWYSASTVFTGAAVSTDLVIRNTQSGGRSYRWISTGNGWGGGLGAGYFVLWDDATGAKMYVSPSNAMVITGPLTSGGGFQYSDRRLKKNIKARAVLRGLALKLARNFREWDLKSDGRHDVGVIAQWVRRITPWYVSPGEDKRKTLAIDKAGIALEASMDNALSIEELIQRVTKLERNAK